MKKILFLTALFILASAPQGWAEPYLAAWQGVNCNACHINQTGGYIRNDFGRNYGNNLRTFDWKGIADTAQALTHKTPTWISAGFDFHESYGASFLPNASSIPNSFNPNSPFVPLGRQSFSIAMKANENITGVFSYRLDENAAKEIYALISDLPSDAYFKLGKFIAPYGLELADDNSLVRNDLMPNIFSFDNITNNGLEFGIYPDVFFLNAAAFNDATNTTEKDFSARGGINLREITLGGSIYNENADYSTHKIRYGAFGWTHIGPVVLLGEYDSGYNEGVAATSDAYNAYHASAEFDLGGDVYLRLTSEYLNDYYLLANFDGFQHILGVRFYPVRNFKCQVNVERLDAAAGSLAYANSPSYGASIDTYMFY